MEKRTNSFGATTVGRVKTADAQPCDSFREVDQGAFVTPVSSAGTTVGSYAVTVVVRGSGWPVVNVPYDLEGERQRQENLRRNGLILSEGPATDSKR